MLDNLVRTDAPYLNSNYTYVFENNGGTIDEFRFLTAKRFDFANKKINQLSRKNSYMYGITSFLSTYIILNDILDPLYKIPRSIAFGGIIYKFVSSNDDENDLTYNNALEM